MGVDWDGEEGEEQAHSPVQTDEGLEVHVEHVASEGHAGGEDQVDVHLGLGLLDV